MTKSGAGDYLVLAVSGLWLLGALAWIVVGSINPPTYPYGGPGPFDSPDPGWIATTIACIFDVGLIVTFSASLCRVIYRVKHHAKS